MAARIKSASDAAILSVAPLYSKEQLCTLNLDREWAVIKRRLADVSQSRAV